MPNLDEYADWTFQNLATVLGGYGIEAVKSHGVKVIRAADVARALADRDEQDGPEAGSRRGGV
jgi:hypothetical protein